MNWTVPSTRVDLATGRIVRTLPIGPSVAVVDVHGTLWVTSSDGNTLTSLRP